ncbi:SPFH domain-containing protein [Candidatus Peregrinibacteria bacterium]|nr:SPFH domain-containing protein [Candidatus Peregrinibacteria bacterium]
MEAILIYIAVSSLIAVALSTVIIKQGNVGVTTLFGKYHRILRPGLNFRVPFAELIFKKISLQNRSVELEFQAITSDQANVNFKTLILYAVENDSEESIKNAAFKFIDDRCFMQALIRSIESSVRSFVATKKQNEVLSLRREIVHEVNSHIDEELNGWGFHLINLQVNDISFDEAIMRSMAQVVATNNMKAAAENEAQAQYISKTRVADAEAQAKRIIAQAEKEADQLRGEGNALLRKQIAGGLAEAGKTMETNGVDPAFMLFTMWLDSMKFIASHSHGNILSLDGSNDGFEKTLKQMSLLSGGNGAGSPVFRKDGSKSAGHSVSNT